MNRFDVKKYQELLQKVPEVSTSSELSNAMKKVQNERRRKKRMYTAMLTAAIFCFLILGMIRYSFSFAYAVAQLPGMKPLVEMIALDKGLQDIVENEYYEEMNVSQTIDGNTLTITGVVADHSGMIIYYKLQSSTDLANMQGPPKVDVLTKNQPLDEVMIGASWSAQSEGTFEVEDTIEVAANEPLNYDVNEFELHFTMPDNPEVTFNLPFTLKQDIKPSKHLPINEVVTMDGQNILVHELILSPIRTELVLSIDSNNTMDILHFADIQLYDDKGEQWGKIKNGVAGKGSLDDEKFSIMLESNYFRIPQSFDIVFKEVEAIPKKDAYVTINWETKEVVEQPAMLNVDIEVKDAYEIIYTLPHYKKNEHKGMFDQMIDAKGNTYWSNSTWISSNEQEQQIGQFYDVQTSPINPVQLKITRYENYLQDEERISINVK